MKIHHYPIPPNNEYLHTRYMAAFNKQLPSKTNEIRLWCFQTFGAPGYLYDTDEVRWVDDARYGEIVFGRESDLMMFLLRWE